MSTPGRKSNPTKDLYAHRYGLTKGQRRKLNTKRIEQLERCKNEAARRLLLGRSA